MPEKSLLAYFHSREEAERALEQMRGLRLIDSSIDRISRYPGEGIENQMNPVTGDFPGLGNLVLDADYSGKSPAILTAADVAASGMSDGGQHAVTGLDILLTAVMEEEDFEQARQIAKQNGGTV